MAKCFSKEVLFNRNLIEIPWFQKFRSSDLPLLIPLSTRTLVYNKPGSPQACTINSKRTNYTTNYFAWVLSHKPLIICDAINDKRTNYATNYFAWVLWHKALIIYARPNVWLMVDCSNDHTMRSHISSMIGFWYKFQYFPYLSIIERAPYCG